jgi:dsDNA-specific endonuclease/ATPase MutS2
MTATAFDTLKLSRRLEAAGMSVPQAISVAEALAETMVVEPASRSDVQKLEAEFRLARQESRFELDKLNAEIGKLRQELHAEIGKLRQEMHAEIDKLRQEMHAEIGKLRQEMQTELAKLRTEMATLKFDLLRWIVPLILAQMAMTLGLFVRLSL